MAVTSSRTHQHSAAGVEGRNFFADPSFDEFIDYMPSSERRLSLSWLA